MLEAGQLVADQAAGEQRTVYVVDDDMGIRMSLVFLLEANSFLPWPFANGFDLIDALPMLEPGCLLLDIRMPKMDGLELMANLQRRGCHWPVIAMTGDGDIPIAVQAMKLGAIEFIEKPFREDLLKSALSFGFAKLIDGEQQRAQRRAAQDRLKTLSTRENEVLRALLAGRQNKVVAHELGLSVRTIEMHRANLLAKLGVRTLPEAIRLISDAERAEPH